MSEGWRKASKSWVYGGLQAVVFNTERDDAERIDRATVSGFKVLLDASQLDQDGCVLQLLRKVFGLY